MQYRSEYRSPLGNLTLASDGERLTGLWLEGQKYFGGGVADAPRREDLPLFAQAKQWSGILQGSSPPPWSCPWPRKAGPSAGWFGGCCWIFPMGR